MTQAPPDPFMAWKAMYDRAEPTWTQPLQDTMASESFVAWMSAVRESTLTQHQATRESMEKYWDSLRLPTKADHARLAGMIVAMEGKIEALEDRLESMEATLEAVLAKLDTLGTAPVSPTVTKRRSR